MTPRTVRGTLVGPAGVLVTATESPAGAAHGLAVLCHPHPQHGGTMDNKVVVTLARALVACGHTAVRFDFRGVGGSAGTYDAGEGEVDDALAVVAALHTPGAPLILGGFSFGGAVAARAAERLAGSGAAADRLILVGPAVQTFAVPPVRADTVVVHGERDDVVPLAAVLDWARPQSLPVVVIPGAGHFFHGQLSLLKQIVVRSVGAAIG